MAWAGARRQDAPDLPKQPVSARTVGKTYTAPDGKTFRPSMFLTLTCPSYGRVGEVRRRNLDLDNRCVRIVETVHEFGQLVRGTPKSEASRRTIRLPELIIPDLWAHLDLYSAPGTEGFVFTGVRGGQLRRSNFSKPWARALAKAGLPAGTHVHDLRHTGNTFRKRRGACGTSWRGWATTASARP